MRRILRLALPALACCLPAGAGAAGAAQVSEEAALKAAFVYRFAQFTQWPPPPVKDFTYCLAGSPEMGDALRGLAARQHEFPQVRFMMLTQASQAAGCQLLVLSLLDRQEMLRWQQALSDAPVLIVGDSPEALRSGAVIALAQEPNGLTFRINNTEAKRRGLILSSQVLKLAREVR
ncbi:YfiR family protein [Roseateles sp. DB2]|uniref:YfiR family protein n=1 Tax=Roseateles sp. DB2 TaxID=3453717 RepID=UPI003EE8A18E